MKKISIFILAVLQLFLFTACKTQPTENGKLQVYTSFYAMYDFAKQIGGDKADVYLLCPAGQEPHDFEPTAQDIAKLSDADIFIYNGMGMEHWTDSVADTLPDSVTVVETSKYATHTVQNGDPHVWLNPKNAYEQVKAITDAFKEKDPTNKDYYNKNLKEFKQHSKHLRQDLETAGNMFRSHTIVVSHDAYSSLCDFLNITQICVNGKDNSSEPTPSRIAEIEKYINENNIKYIFTEPMGASDIMETIAEDTDCEILVLDPFEGNAENKDYFKVMYENIAALTEALN